MNRRLLAFQSAMFATVLVLPPPVDMVMLPLFFGLKLYKLFTVYLVFKLVVSSQASNLVSFATLIPRISEQTAMTAVAAMVKPLLVTTAPVTPTVLAYPVSVSWLYFYIGGLMVLLAIIGEAAVFYFLIIYPTLYVRRYIYPRVSRMLRDQ